MGCLSYQPFVKDFVAQGQDAYKQYIKTDGIHEVVPCEDFFKGLDDELIEKNSKIENETEFLSEANSFFEKFCNNIKEEEKRFGMAQELDSILIVIIRDIKEREILHLASILQKRTGHRLQRFKSVCGYGLSGVFMKFEIKMLKEVHEQDDIIAFLEKIISLDKELKDMKVYDLVAFVVIDKLPVLNPDQHLMLKIWKKNKDQSKGPRKEHSTLYTQTVGAIFEIEGEDGYFFSTVTHGEDFKDHKFAIVLDGMDPVKAEYWESEYVLPCWTPSKSCDGVEKDLHSPADEGYEASDEREGSPVSKNMVDTDDALQTMGDYVIGATAATKNDEAVFTFDTSELSEDDAEMKQIEADFLRDNQASILGSKAMKRLQHDRSTPSPRPHKFVKQCFDYSRSLNNSPCVGESRRPSKTPKTPNNQSLISLGDSGFGSSLSSRNTSFISLNSSTCDSPTQALAASLSRMSSEVFMENDGPQAETNSFEVGTPHLQRTSTCPDIQSFGQDRRGSYEGMGPPHVDFCLLKVNGSELKEYFEKKRMGCQMVENIMPVTDEIVKKTVRKYGISTQATEGKVVAVDYTMIGALKGKEVYMYNMVITEQKHNFSKIKDQLPYSNEPVNLTEDVKNAGAVTSNENQAVGGALEEATAGLAPFVKKGDSGAIITTLPSGDEKEVQPFANHLYHYNSERNVYGKKLNYSVSSPLDQCVEKLEQKIKRKIRMVPIVCP